MIKFIFASILIITTAAANSPVGTVVDYLRGTPALVRGTISLDGVHQIYKGKKGIFDIGMKINATKPISFSFSEKNLSISSDQGLSLTIQGIPIKVTNINYQEHSGKFQVQTDTPLGLGEKMLNSHIEKVLNDHYKPKMIKAFRELKSIRSQKSLNDVNQVISSIAGIFSTEKQVPLPVIRGNVQLGFYAQGDKNLKLDKWSAGIKAHDAITFGMDFVKTKSSIVVNAVNIRSSQGIRISGKTKFPEIASINFKDLEADAQGIKVNYDIGAEEVIVGFQILLGVLQSYSGHPSNVLNECDPVRLESIRKSLDENLRKEIAVMIRVHRKSLIKAGASPQLLAALD